MPAVNHWPRQSCHQDPPMPQQQLHQLLAEQPVKLTGSRRPFPDDAPALTVLTMPAFI